MEAKVLAALGTIDLGSLFWGEPKGTTPGADIERNLFDARCKEESGWHLPPRLHLTTKFFGRDPSKTVLAEAEALVNTWHEVEAAALVFVRGGGLLCVECALRGPGAAALQNLAGEGWRPHVTLLTASPWFAKDSTAMLRAWENYKAAAEENPQGSDVAAPADDVILLGDSTEEEAEEQQQEVQEEEEEEDADLRASLRGVLGPAAPPPPPMPEDDAAERKSSTAELAAEVISGVSLLGRQVDLCRIALDPPPKLGPCKFKMFHI